MAYAIIKGDIQMIVMSQQTDLRCRNSIITAFKTDSCSGQGHITGSEPV